MAFINKANKGSNASETSLEAIEGRLWNLEHEDLIDLALEFDESPMRYFTKQSLVQMNYLKRHYINQLAHAFFENPHRMDYLTGFEQRAKRRKMSFAEAASLAAAAEKARALAWEALNS